MELVVAWLAVALFATLVTEWRLRRYRERAVVRRTWREALVVMVRVTDEHCCCNDNPHHPCPACCCYADQRRIMRRHAGLKD